MEVNSVHKLFRGCSLGMARLLFAARKRRFAHLRGFRHFQKVPPIDEKFLQAGEILAGAHRRIKWAGGHAAVPSAVRSAPSAVEHNTNK